MKQTTECTKCGGGTGQSKPCVCAVARQASDAVVVDEYNETVGGLEFKSKLKEVPAHRKTRRNKSDRKRNKRQRWK